MSLTPSPSARSSSVREDGADVNSILGDAFERTATPTEVVYPDVQCEDLASKLCAAVQTSALGRAKLDYLWFSGGDSLQVKGLVRSWV